MPKVSVVIPTFNRAADLSRALQSVRGQSLEDWECIVVDNHSTDGSDEVVARCGDSRLRLLKIHNNGIIAASRNKGIAHATGEYVAFLDSDDWWTRDKLQASVARLEQGAAFVYHDLFMATRSPQRWYWRRSRTRGVRKPVFTDLLTGGNAINTSSVVVRRSVMEAVNGFAEERSLIAAEDYDAWLRIARITEDFARIPRTLGYYWVGSGNTTNHHRTLQLLDTLEERYARDFHELGARHKIYWLSYLRARSHYQMGSFDVARQHLSLVDAQRVPLWIQAKCMWMRTAMGVQRTCARA